jgi:phosphatidylglycerol:prolipoprotein diacylglycerol transferase
MFDLDGTLVDSREAIYDSAISVLSQYSKHLPTKEEVFKSVGLPVKILFSQFLDESVVDAAVPEFRSHLKEFGADKTKLLPNAIETLIAFKEKDISIGLVSNKQTALAKSILEQQNIDTASTVIEALV